MTNGSATPVKASVMSRPSASACATTVSNGARISAKISSYITQATTMPTAIASSDLTSRERSSRRCSDSGIAPESAGAPPGSGPRLTAGALTPGWAAGPGSAAAGPAPAGPAGPAAPAGSGHPRGGGQRRRGGIVDEPLGLGLEDPQGPADAACGVRQPLGAEEQHDEEHQDEQLRAFEVGHGTLQRHAPAVAGLRLGYGRGAPQPNTDGFDAGSSWVSDPAVRRPGVSRPG